MNDFSKTINVEEIPSWDAYLNRVTEISRMQISPDSPPGVDFVFRGQANYKWDLDTTLERFKNQTKNPLDEYYRDIVVCSTQIESLTNERWNLKSLDEYEQWLADQLRTMTLSDFHGYDLMAYLRHHGFPSPLLDWTRSPAVAGWFAFSNVASGVEKVSVYAYSEMPTGIKSGATYLENIKHLGPYVRTHKRHFQQQSEYTICTSVEGKIYYDSHEKVFCRTRGNHQDLLLKLNIPASERIKALKYLDRYNVNAFSLFGTEDSLCQTIAMRRYFLEKEV